MKTMNYVRVTDKTLKDVEIQVVRNIN